MRLVPRPQNPDSIAKTKECSLTGIQQCMAIGILLLSKPTFTFPGGRMERVRGDEKSGRCPSSLRATSSDRMTQTAPSDQQASSSDGSDQEEMLVLNLYPVDHSVISQELDDARVASNGSPPMGNVGCFFIIPPNLPQIFPFHLLIVFAKIVTSSSHPLINCGRIHSGNQEQYVSTVI